MAYSIYMFAYISDQLSQESSLTSYTSFVLDALRLSRSVYKVIVKVEVRVQLQCCCCCCALSLLSVKLDPQTANTAQLCLSVCVRIIVAAQTLAIRSYFIKMANNCELMAVSPEWFVGIRRQREQRLGGS